MTDKLTNAEVKKALECCTTKGASCKDCPAYVKVDRSNCKQVLKGALDLINRQEAEKESLKAEVESLKEIIKVLRVSGEQAHLVRKDGKSPLSLLMAEIKAEAYKEFAERSEKEIFIKQDDERKQMLEILKTYRGTKAYSDTEQATDNWLRGYGEAVQDILGVFNNLLNELVGNTSAEKNK